MHEAADHILSIYRRHADAFANRRNKQLIERNWLDKFLALLPDAPRILDIGCGTGDPIARYLKEQGCRVTGVDGSPEMLTIAQRNAPDGDWRLADMRALNLGQQFDGIIAWNSAFHLTPDDQIDLFPMYARHAAPSAALMFTSGTGHGTAMGIFEGEPLYHGSLAPQMYRDLLNENGFEVVEHVEEDPECGAHTIWLSRAVLQSKP